MASSGDKSQSDTKEALRDRVNAIRASRGLRPIPDKKMQQEAYIRVARDITDAIRETLRGMVPRDMMKSTLTSDGATKPNVITGGAIESSDEMD